MQFPISDIPLSDMIKNARLLQPEFAACGYLARQELIIAYADALKQKRTLLAKIVADDAKKTAKDAASEVDSAIDILGKTISDAALPDLGTMKRQRIKEPVGIVALITSFNFPIAVAHWNIAPALLAGNVVLWKPSEKTPHAAMACKEIFDIVAGNNHHALQIVRGGREIGAQLVADEAVDMISATGSVAMGEAIARALAGKRNNQIPPILELGGNNALVISEHISNSHLNFALEALLRSFLATTGQRCTNTRRLIIHKSWFEQAVTGLQNMLAEHISSGLLGNPDNEYGYRELIDDEAYKRFENAVKTARNEGGKIVFGEYNQPALAIMPKQSAAMHEETFAPLLYIVAYDGDLENAMTLVNAPDNAGLVNGIYTLSKAEAEQFIRLNQAGHSVINSPKGTGTPAFGLGFGGNKSSGSGEILWNADPLAAFTKRNPLKRAAINSEIKMNE